MTAQSPISRLVAATDRVTFSDAPTPEQLASARQRLVELTQWVEGLPVGLPVWAMFSVCALGAAVAALAEDPRNETLRDAVRITSKAAHKVEALLNLKDEGDER